MQIVIHCGGMPFNGATIPNGESLGGSESAAYFMGKELKRLGHQVVLFTSYQAKKGEPTDFDGVNYAYMGKQDEQFPLGNRFHTIMRVPHDVLVVQRAPMAFYRPLNSKLNIWWLHDIALIRQANMVIHHLPFIDQILTVSEWHRQQVAEIYDLDPDIITPTANGVDYDMFEGLQSTRSMRQPKSCAFAARPERGLREIVKENGLAELLPDVHFHVCTYKSVPAHMQDLYNYCWHRCQQLPNVTNHGFLGKRDLYSLISKCMLYVYPTCFEDTSNIMILESNAVGTPFVAPADLAALPETGKGAGMFWVDISKNYQYGHPEKSELSDVDIKRFADKINHIFASPETQWAPAHQKALSKRQPWSDAALQWEQLFKKLFRDRADNEERFFRHCEHYSDVHFLKDRYKDRLQKNYYFIYDNDYKGHYDSYYEYEESRGVKYGAEDLTGNPRFEHTLRITQQLNPKSILDYGCAHGHYVMNMAMRFPDIDYTGIDINQKNIDIAKSWHEEKKSYLAKDGTRKSFNIQFIHGETDAIPAKYDLILCTEVLEHVPDPAGLVEKLMQHLTPNGWMLLCVPYGAWESIGYLEHPGWRAHIHHFERQDLMDIFDSQSNYKLEAVPHSTNLGHYILIFQPSGKPLGKIDRNRKMAEQAPRETVSACLICKNGEHELGRTIKSIQGVYDQLIVGIDKTSTDDTESICQQFDAEYFYIETPVGENGTGFAAARNETIKRATMDWVLWIDSDEKLENAENLHRYLRPNCYDGYGIKQHHFAVDPEGILKTDFPCRLFRNHRGLKFYGHVHEHPEQEMNEGPGKVYVIPDVAIMHTGYATEMTRRKRFERNFPLMQIERKKNPNRNLGKFLWMRDLVQLCRYEMERNGRADIAKYTTEAIETWREIIHSEKPNIRLIIDSLPYYSDAAMLKNRGQAIEFRFDYQSTKFKPLKPKDQPLHSFFDSEQDIKDLINLLVNENIKYYGEQYY
jgi:2-polyprenyl-3-methyl-5-hydroxy-6-metoxy-1,4-benzoquinol methylase/glycosyltransferase involved in cell wall biosynthesis/GT2 family glycosyltransferase